MLGRLNHVAIAVPDLEAAASVYAETLGAEVSAPQPLPEHGVTVVFVAVPNTKIELLEPLGKDSPIARFLEKTRRVACITFVTRSMTLVPPETGCWQRGPGCLVTVNPKSAHTASRFCFCTRRISVGR